MSTFYYRIPGSEIVSLQGNWSIQIDKPIGEFWLSDFEANTFYCFEPNHSEEKVFQNLSFSKQKPIVILRDKYLKSAEKIIKTIQENEGSKIIYSRIEGYDFNGKHSIKLFNKLCEMYPEAFVYIVSSTFFGTWIGASPEVLVSIEKEKAFTMALAGTKQKDDDSDWTEKETVEHEIVSEFIQNTLSQNEYVSNLKRNEKIEQVAGESKHLQTNFSFDLKEANFINVVLNLHPTPAVSGFPIDFALDAIRRNEGHKRQLYSGIVSVEGNQAFVNLRCAQIQKDSIYLYLGGGFNALSNPNDEFQETVLKARTMLSALNAISK